MVYTELLLIAAHSQEAKILGKTKPTKYENIYIYISLHHGLVVEGLCNQ